MPLREDFTIPASGLNLRIAATSLLPSPSTQNEKHKPPVIIMAHGIGAVKAAGLLPIANRLVSAGYAALLFDYLHFGESDGQPSNVLSVPRELQDFKDVIAWARAQSENWDTKRVVVWGTSFGGMHVTSLMSEDSGLAAGIMQCPCVDGLAAARKMSLSRTLRMMPYSVADWLRSFVSEEPIYVPLFGEGDGDGVGAGTDSPPAVMSGPEVVKGWKRMCTDKDAYFPNKLAARSLLSLPFFRPVLRVHRSVRPLLVVLPTWDTLAPLEEAEDVVRLAPLGEGLRVPGGHFDVYEGGVAFERNMQGQLKFLERVLAR